jgi:hypothetical protein
VVANSIVTPQQPWSAVAVATTANTNYATPTNTVLMAQTLLLPVDPFATVNGSAVVTVSAPDHNLTTGLSVTLAGAGAVGGITPSGAYKIAVVDAGTFTITHGSAATSSATGGGAAATAQLTRTSANGVRITKLSALAQATNTATECQLFISSDGGTTRRFVASALLAAYTVAQTTRQVGADFGYSDSFPLILGASETLYVAIGVSNTGIVFRAEGYAY